MSEQELKQTENNAGMKDPAQENVSLEKAEDKHEEAKVPSEETEDMPVENKAKPPVESLTKELDEVKKKADENWDLLVRARAEIENLRKRHDRDLENAHKYGLERFTNELLQVRDSLELGHLAAIAEEADVDKLREGTELTLKLLTDVMEKFGIEQLNPEGEAFNPELHQAMSMAPKEDVDPNTVIQVVQKGYRLNGRLLRPAMVIVSKAN